MTQNYYKFTKVNYHFVQNFIAKDYCIFCHKEIIRNYPKGAKRLSHCIWKQCKTL